MKFAKYLQQTQTPEWKKAYIDYRGLKKKLHKERTRPSFDSQLHLPITVEPEHYPDELGDDGPSTSRFLHDAGMGLGELPVRRRSFSTKKTASQTPLHEADQSSHQRKPSSNHLSRTTSGTKKPRSQHSKGILARANVTLRGPSHPFSGTIPMHDLIPLLSPQEASFIEALDEELEKIEKFYDARKKEMETRTKLLEAQLIELNAHHQRFHEAQAGNSRWNTILQLATKFKNLQPNLLVKHGSDESPSQKFENSEIEKNPPQTDSEYLSSNKHDLSLHRHLDPEEYQTAKKKLNKAVFEHYRGLEMLQNYRILNITGFRKALKKFEKVTRIPVQHAYMTERVETSSFASDKTLRGMMDEMEALYASHFAHGDQKRAKTRLRAGGMNKTHHYSTFRSGVLLGAGVPALVSGIVSSFQPETRDSIPGWDGLLFVYGTLLVPVVFSLLVGINLLVWSHSRINYIFIFELDPRTRLDHREYFEIPSLMFATLCYAFWLSFTPVGSPSISPDIWPLVWLGFTAVVMFDPFNIFFKSSRYWLIKSISKLLTSGTRRVEFADFWMGDQFCSLVFTLSDLYLFACTYAVGFDNWRQCGSTAKTWPAAFILASLPFLIRVIQSIKRYVDSKLNTHLINGGKYLCGIIYYLCYYIWRHQGSLRNTSFAFWCLFGTLYSVYASAWDFWMDWSLLRPHVKYPLLRAELIYTDHIPLYYFAIISNALIRFIWVIYIPSSSAPDMYWRFFIAGFLEMLRRWQWNFIRLENEHLGNMDQYRVTREVPLPYSFDNNDHHIDETSD